MRTVLFLLFSFALSVEAGDSRDWSSVYADTKDSIPILYASGGLCSGTLISSDLILTASHCVEHLRPVVVGWSDNVKLYEPAKIIAYNKKDDVALVRLNTPSKRKPIKLSSVSEELRPGQPIATIGHPVSAGGGVAANRSRWKSPIRFRVVSFHVSPKVI